MQWTAGAHVLGDMLNAQSDLEAHGSGMLQVAHVLLGLHHEHDACRLRVPKQVLHVLHPVT
jgi:hypothetical protein